MPNYVTSTCRVVGTAEEIGRFKAAVIGTAPAQHSDAGGKLFNFDALIPMPPILRDVGAGSHEEMGAALICYRADRGAPYADYGELWSKSLREELHMREDNIADVAATYLAQHPDIEAKGRKRLQAILETGYASWYPWSIANWGTKWGAFRFHELPDEPDYSFRYETAWSFPTPIFERLAATFPTLSFDCATYDEGDNFAGYGWFNPPAGERAFELCDVTDDLYERVYGRTKPVYEDEEEEA